MAALTTAKRLDQRFTKSTTASRGSGFHSQFTFLSADQTLYTILCNLKLTQHTIVIFSSDNGPESASAKAPSQRQRGKYIAYNNYYSIGSTGGMRGRKRNLFEGGIRLPFIVRWPGHTPAGVVNEETEICAVDLLPTLCAAAGVTLPADYRGDGENMLPTLEGKKIQRKRPLFWEWEKNHLSGKDSWPNLAVQEGEWKLLLTYDSQRMELYRLSVDRKEANELSKQYPEITERLKGLALKWKQSLPREPDTACFSKARPTQSESRDVSRRRKVK